jgi:hypothetical protein
MVDPDRVPIDIWGVVILDDPDPLPGQISRNRPFQKQPGCFPGHH